MHGNKIIHRDIKLENILLDFPQYSNEAFPGKSPIDIKLDNINISSHFNVKIADLGYARELRSVTSTICGTPIIMAPDILNLNALSPQDRKYNTKADLWSLGAITYELLVGKPPFYSYEIHDLIAKVNKGNYTIPKNLKLSIESISFINGLLQFNPEKRMAWEQIDNHPFLTKIVEDLHFIDIKQNCNFANDKEIQLNIKNYNNYQWLNYYYNSFNIPLDQVNDHTIKQPELQEMIKNNSIINEELLKEVEEEKIKIMEEKK